MIRPRIVHARLGSALSVVGALALVIAGCGDEAVGPASAPTSAPIVLPIAADRSALRPPGTELAEGVEVQEGSWLVGEAVPHGEDDAGWTALVVLDGDPVEVWDRYATALGVDDRADAAHACVVLRVGDPLRAPDEPIPHPPARLLTRPRIDGENRVACSAQLDDVTMLLGYGSSYSPDVCERAGTGAAPECRRTAEAHLYLATGDDRGPARFGADELRYRLGGTSDELAPVPEGEVVAPAFSVTPDVVDLAVAGDDLGGTHVGRPGWVLPDGMRELVAPTTLLQCADGLVTVLAAASEPVAAVTALLSEAHPADRGPIREGSDRRGRRWAAGSSAEAGGYHVNLVALDSGADRSTVVVTVCND